MARICCVESCKAVPQEDITFFNFPIKQSLQKKWKEAIKPVETLTVESVICSQHFTSEDYETVRGKVRLKAKVVPTIFHHMDSPKSPKISQRDPQRNGYTDPPCEMDKEMKELEALNNNCKDSNKVTEGERAEEQGLAQNGHEDESAEKQGLEEDGHEDIAEYDVPVELNCEVQLTEGEENETIECVPEAILHEDSDSHSEGDIHKEDIEDIIANYHIKQDPKLAERLKASQEKENLSNNQDNKSEECNKSDKGCNKSDKVSNKSDKECIKSGNECNKKDTLPPDKDNDCVEVEVTYQPGRKRRKLEYIEIPVDKDPTDKSNDCLMLMENVQVDIDPSSLLFAQGDPDDDTDDSDVEETEVSEKDSKRKNASISLLTSSDDDDVIIEEPHIDTVEVSDETDEDDVPLTRLIKTDAPDKPISHVGQILWGTLAEYYCYKCKYTTTTHADYIKHKKQHEKVFNVCEICDFSTASKTQFVRHKRRHKDEKLFKCHLCDYKAKHHMSLIYHLKSHGIDEREARLRLKAKENKCPKCKVYFTNFKSEYAKHVKGCQASGKIHKCLRCDYATKRAGDLRRHSTTNHSEKRKRASAHKGSDGDDDEDFEP